ncbi:MAG: hypothetical protein ABJD11_11760 [Gemmatimonadota bacterium]
MRATNGWWSSTWYAVGVAVLLAGIGAWACPPKLTIKDVRPECPQDSIHIVVENPETKGSYYVINQLTLAGDHAKVPEFNDCQRFVLAGSDSFGPLVAIWAAEHLDLLVDSLYSIQTRNPGSKIAIAAAEIHNYDATYRPLEIEHDFSCLYLWVDASALKAQPSTALPNWEARIVPVGVNEPDCAKPVDFAKLPSGGLEVRLDAVPRMSDADIPPVARWDWDSVRSQHYIGIKCGANWCEIGARDFTPLPTHQISRQWDPIPAGTTASALVKPIMPLEEIRVQSVKGWYDEQRLAVVGSNGRPALSPVLGRVYPHPSLQRINDVTVYDKQWIPSALVDVEANYMGKLHLTMGYNAVYLCRGAACPVPAGTATCGPDDQDRKDPWWAMIVSSSGTSYHCVMRREHYMNDIPASARWRWSESDEKIWVRCTTGCCTVS